MDDNFRELEREAFEAAFKGEEDKSGSTDAGYGLDPRQADSQAMAEAFNGADVAVGGPNPEPKIEADPLPAPNGNTMAATPEGESAKPADPIADAKPQTPQFKTFGQAFKYHRQQAANGGPKTFEWNGKQFTTSLKSEVAAAPKKTSTSPAPAAAKKPAAAKPSTAPASESLAQSKGREYTEAWQAAEKSKSYADKVAAEKALKVAEDAAAAQKEGKSVVLKRDPKPNIAETVMKESLPDPTSTEYAGAGGKRFFSK